MQLSAGTSSRIRMALTCTPKGLLAPPLAAPPHRRNRASCRPPLAALPLDTLHDVASQVASHLPLLYKEPVALPCSLMKCGDVVYRSTLDPALYQQGGLDWRGVALLASVAAYLTLLPPGVLPGVFDHYVWGPIHRRQMKVYAKTDIVLGRKLATGGFGTVFRADLRQEDGTLRPVILKKAKEFGEAEAWMNERMVRQGGKHCAEFVTAFDESLVPPTATGVSSNNNNNKDESIWLVWQYEGDYTLFDLMQKKEFPYNLEPLIFGRELRVPKGVERKNAIVKEAMRQIVESVAACHRAGIIHRDIKPQNCIISNVDKKLKLIDLGAAADLRIGINYVPNEYLLDPRYSPPQMYIMSKQTPKPPPPAVAAFLAPVLWFLERPDRFDMYSVGVVLLQLAFANLRNDDRLIAFNKRMEAMNFDLRRWRAEEEASGKMSPDTAEGFEILDQDGGAGWDLLCSLMTFQPGDRLPAKDALAHPYLNASALPAVPPSPLVSSVRTALGSLSKSTSGVMAFMDGAVNREGALTEAQLQEELGLEPKMEKPSRDASQTITWWQQRQTELEKKLTERLSQGGSSAVGSGKVRSGGAGSGSFSGPVTPRSTPSFKVPLVVKKGAAANGNGNGKAANGNGKQAPAAAPARPAMPLKFSVLRELVKPLSSRDEFVGYDDEEVEAFDKANGNGKKVEKVEEPKKVFSLPSLWK